MRCIVVLSVIALVGCGSTTANLPAPGAEGTVVVNVWEPDGSPPTVLVAERIRQEGARFERLVLERVRARVLLPDLDCAVSAPSGLWSTAQGQLTLEGPVRLAGTWQGTPVLGSASTAALAREGQALLLGRLELWHNGQRLTAPTAELRRDGTLSYSDIDVSPLPPELAAVMDALPNPLVLPR